jgi:hypothetical protein
LSLSWQQQMLEIIMLLIVTIHVCTILLKTFSLLDISGKAQIQVHIITALVRPLFNISSITHMTVLQGFCE